MPPYPNAPSKHHDNTTPFTQCTMSTSMPTVKDFIASFLNQIPLVTGEPTYETLKNLCHLLQANTASVACTLGGGQHGYLGLVLYNAAYAMISAMTFIPPNFPGQHPTIPQGSSTAVTTNIICYHTESTCAQCKFMNIPPPSKTNSFMNQTHLCPHPS